jgi:hypothetical protein
MRKNSANICFLGHSSCASISIAIAPNSTKHASKQREKQQPLEQKKTEPV